MVQGVYLMPSYGRYDIVSELTKMLIGQKDTFSRLIGSETSEKYLTWIG